MAWLRRQIQAAGYETWARTYPSRSRSLQELGDQVVTQIRDELGDRPVAAVTHSMGGVLARHMAAALPWQRLVMVAPPNRGSAVAATINENPIFRWFYGPAGQQLASPEHWPVPDLPFAVIAGTRGLSWKNATSVLSAGLKVFAGPNDGTVSVDETQLDGMADFATVDATHTWIMYHPEVVEMILRFLETGRLR